MGVLKLGLQKTSGDSHGDQLFVKIFVLRIFNVINARMPQINNLNIVYIVFMYINTVVSLTSDGKNVPSIFNFGGMIQCRTFRPPLHMIHKGHWVERVGWFCFSMELFVSTEPKNGWLDQIWCSRPLSGLSVHDWAFI